ncbi:helix-turn-helix domain-containing protein [Paenisporosarcina macmurdoensis]|uniref:Helix-turn-helix domain-containing protein n=1 Tax=Paenisporosarcina macmurdoensis TaxID=212659 RepID=A0ABW1L3R3_9BACL
MRGDILRKLRKEKKLTQEQLGKIINVTKVSVSGYESGNRSPDNDTLQDIANYFEVTTDYLLGRTDNPKLINYNMNENKPTGLGAIDTSGLTEYQQAVLEWAFSREHAHFGKKKEDVLEMLEALEVVYERQKQRKDED